MQQNDLAKQLQLDQKRKYISNQVQSLQQKRFNNTDFENLLNSRLVQLEIVEYFDNKRNLQAETIEDQNEIILKFLNSYILAIQSGHFEVLEVFLEDVMIESGILEPFIGPGGKVGVPGQVDEETACDNMMEVIRACAAGVISIYLYVNVQQKHGTFAPDHVAAMFLALSLNTIRKEQSVVKIEGELQQRGRGSDLRCSDLQWLLKWLQAELSGRVAEVYQMLGDEVLSKANRDTRQRSLLHMIKAKPNCATGYSLYCRSCVQNDQYEAALLFGRKGLDVAITQNNKFEECCLTYLIVLCLVSVKGDGKLYTKDQVFDLVEKADQAKALIKSYLPDSIQDETVLDQLSQIIKEQVINQVQQNQTDEVIPIQLKLDVDRFSIPQGSMVVYD